jgi:hypothetical protein
VIILCSGRDVTRPLACDPFSRTLQNGGFPSSGALCALLVIGLCLFVTFIVHLCSFQAAAGLPHPHAEVRLTRCLCRSSR